MTTSDSCPPNPTSVAKQAEIAAPGPKKEEIYTIIAPRELPSRRIPPSKAAAAAAARHPNNKDNDVEEPLIDTTAALVLRSKRTERKQKKAQSKSKRSSATACTGTPSLLGLPIELLHSILTLLLPTDLQKCLGVSKALQAFILQNEAPLVREILRWRYPILSRTFYLPYPLSSVASPRTQAVLKAPLWQERLAIHTKPYAQHVPLADAAEICSCMACVYAWNNLCLVLDLAHFAPRLAAREPLPIFARGAAPPEWNVALLQRHASIVRRAVFGSSSLDGRRGGGGQQGANSPQPNLTYAAILQLHLATTAATLMRPLRVHKNKIVANPAPKYAICRTDVAAGTDAFLARKGASELEFPYMRDKYHYLDAYVPNRRWSEREGRWMYASPQHESDVAWVAARFREE